MKRIKKLLCLILASLMLILCACEKSPAIMEYEGQVINAEMYTYWMSRYKALFLYSYANSTDSPDFWNTEVADGITAETLFTNIIDENIKKNLACMYLFDKYSLALPSSTVSAIDADMEQLIEDIGGAKAFEEEADALGINKKTLKEIYLIEEKIEYLRNHLYGTNGVEKITDAQKKAYMEDNYVRIRHIFFSTSPEYVLDANGSYTYDENGNIITKTPTAEEINKKKVTAEAVFERINQGEDFEKMLSEYTDDDASISYKNGFYLTSSIDYIDEVTEAAFDMEVGEVRLVNSDYGVHIVKRYELQDKAYDDKSNADFFENFDDAVISEIFQNKLAEHFDKITVNTEEKSKYSIVTTKANLKI